MDEHAALIYCRVSTKSQAEEGTSLESQEKACRALASQRGLLVAKVFKEDWPGDTLDRPLLRQVRDGIKTGQCSAVICHATDRLARKPVHLAIVAEECERAGINLIFVTEPLDNSAEGQLIRYVKGYAAEIEREKIRERTMRGKQSRAANGMLPQGTGKGTYGYRYNRATGRREPAESEAEVVKRVFRMCIDGMACHSIAVILNKDNVPALGGGKWHPRTIHRMLTNPAYKGVTVFGRTRRVALGGRDYKIVPKEQKEWVEIKDATPAIVGPEEWERAQGVLAKPRRMNHVEGRRYLLTGFVQCECGTPLVGTCLNKTYHYYRCRGTWPTAIKPKTCDAPYINSAKLEDEVWRSVTEILRRPELVIKEIKRRKGQSTVLDDEVTRIQGAVRGVTDQERRLVRLYRFGEIDDAYILKETAQLKKERVGLEADLARLERQRQELSSLDQVGDKVREFCARVSAKLDEFSFEDKRLALAALQIKVVVGRGGVKLYGVIPQLYATIGQTSGDTFTERLGKGTAQRERIPFKRRLDYIPGHQRKVEGR